MHIIQFHQPALGRCLGVVQNDKVANITARDTELTNTVAAFHKARRHRQRLADLLQPLVDGLAPSLDYAELLAAGQVLPPLTEEGVARLLVSGTGLTHTGSVQQRDAMHDRPESAEPQSDSRKMFQMGLAGGRRPAAGTPGRGPGMVFQGRRSLLAWAGRAARHPGLVPDGGEEPEVVGLYTVDDAGIPCRLGFTQGNEWSDHVTEKIIICTSPRRSCAFVHRPELVIDASV